MNHALDHVMAGLLVAACLAGMVVVLGGLWWLVRGFVGEAAATVAVIGIALFGVGAAVVDWITE